MVANMEDRPLWSDVNKVDELKLIECGYTQSEIEELVFNLVEDIQCLREDIESLTPELTEENILVLYTKGNKSQFKDFPHREVCTFINTKYQKLKDCIQGIRFTGIVVSDLGVTLEDEALANSHQVSKSFYNNVCKNSKSAVKIHLEDKDLISL